MGHVILGMVTILNPSKNSIIEELMLSFFPISYSGIQPGLLSHDAACSPLHTSVRIKGRSGH